MDKELILNRLWDTIEKLVNLPDKNFDYSLYVTKGNINKGCGTVCCVAGWYPKWFPESGLTWGLRGYADTREIILSYFEGLVTDQLSDYHGLSWTIINFLFHGSRENLQLSKKGYKLKEQIFDYWEEDVNIFDFGFADFSVKIKSGLNASKSQVTMGFRFIHYLIENDYIIDYENN